MANPKHTPTAEQRKTVKAMAAYGISQADIGRVIGIHDETLRLHYAEEIATAAAEANAKVAQSLFQMATSGKNVAAAIFWMKTRARWKEVQALEHTGADGVPLNVAVTFVKPNAVEEG
jgi:hypothetical protein